LPGTGCSARRRRNGRWTEEETQFLILNVREHGKGKWKKILELGTEIFQKRSQVIAGSDEILVLLSWGEARHLWH
jgi:hypothetical protein